MSAISMMRMIAKIMPLESILEQLEEATLLVKLNPTEENKTKLLSVATMVTMSIIDENKSIDDIVKSGEEIEAISKIHSSMAGDSRN